MHITKLGSFFFVISIFLINIKIINLFDPMVIEANIKFFKVKKRVIYKQLEYFKSQIHNFKNVFKNMLKRKLILISF